MACVQTSAPLRNAYKISCLQKVVYIYISYRSQHCSGASGLKKKELGAWREKRREDRECKCSHNPVKSASRTLHSFHTFHTLLHMHGPTCPKARATPTNYLHMLVQRSLRCARGIHCKHVTPSTVRDFFVKACVAR